MPGQELAPAGELTVRIARQFAPRKADLVKLLNFVGMSFDEAAAALGIAVPTAKQWWAYARAWLTVELRKDAPR